jgi:hypothetical protein
MNDKPVDELSEQEFERLIDGFLMRSGDAVAPTIFLSALREFLQERTTKVVELTAEISGGQLHFDPTRILLWRHPLRHQVTTSAGTIGQ